ncbi:MAG TPA: hypothetical protein ENL34_14220, partial [Chloroflexi bacterium]|nr:hypothetical protein [Chloroflexota bacterium]
MSAAGGNQPIVIEADDDDDEPFHPLARLPSDVALSIMQDWTVIRTQGVRGRFLRMATFGRVWDRRDPVCLVRHYEACGPLEGFTDDDASPHPLSRIPAEVALTIMRDWVVIEVPSYPLTPFRLEAEYGRIWGRRSAPTRLFRRYACDYDPSDLMRACGNPRRLPRGVHLLSRSTGKESIAHYARGGRIDAVRRLLPTATDPDRIWALREAVFGGHIN